MVTIQKPTSRSSLSSGLVLCCAATALICLVIRFFLLSYTGSYYDASTRLNQQARGARKPSMISLVPVDEIPPQTLKLSQRQECPYTSISDLSESELHPQQGLRHMVAPPKGGKLTLVCCTTTKGYWNIVVHHKWAPLGAGRFIDMVKSGYFSATVPMMRCLRNFLCQFGLSGDPDVTKKYKSTIKDDTNWLPEGPTHKQNADGVKRFAKGYLAYAGAGPNSRGQQFIVSLTDVGPLAGGSPWEVPWGELVGQHSFDTLSKITTKYGEKGPTQGKLSRLGVTDELREEFPELDYITSCQVADEVIQEE